MDIYYNTNLIEHETDKALLLKIPKKDHFFWISKRFISLQGSKGSWMKVYIPSGFQIDIRSRKGKTVETASCDKLYDYCKIMSDEIENTLLYLKQKDVHNFIANKVRLDNPTSDMDCTLRD